MDYNSVIDLITTLGFPIACVVALGAFIFYVYKKQSEKIATYIGKIQEDAKAREEKLYEEIALNREISGKAIETIALYAERLNTIEGNVEGIKNDVLVIKEKLSN